MVGEYDRDHVTAIERIAIERKPLRVRSQCSRRSNLNGDRDSVLHWIDRIEFDRWIKTVRSVGSKAMWFHGVLSRPWRTQSSEGQSAESPCAVSLTSFENDGGNLVSSKTAP